MEILTIIGAITLFFLIVGILLWKADLLKIDFEVDK